MAAARARVTPSRAGRGEDVGEDEVVSVLSAGLVRMTDILGAVPDGGGAVFWFTACSGRLS
ncbi:hypothetical protein ACFFX0_23445 [Citricoccus parietis]|uniref:Uncharacterized protein n=1 Tax=Citricoccus parietis TaxID=592307 RepID=A0ABV5G513_9MICC